MFQSTHPHGVRRIQGKTRRLEHCFNPRTHTGCDLHDFVLNLGPNIVSIHAPTRGATRCSGVRGALRNSFNPRTHTGCDRALAFFLFSPISFNPRTHTGCDLHDFVLNLGPNSVSIHAPTRGATFTILFLILVQILFQSTHPHGVRHDKQHHTNTPTMFQSTHPHGVRLYIQQMSEYQLNKVSISRS